MTVAMPVLRSSYKGLCGSSVYTLASTASFYTKFRSNVVRVSRHGRTGSLARIKLGGRPHIWFTTCVRCRGMCTASKNRQFLVACPVAHSCLCGIPSWRRKLKGISNERRRLQRERERERKKKQLHIFNENLPRLETGEEGMQKADFKR